MFEKLSPLEKNQLYLAQIRAKQNPGKEGKVNCEVTEINLEKFANKIIYKYTISFGEKTMDLIS